MKRTTMSLGGLLVAVAASTLASAETWDVTTQFSIENGNPNGAWSYGWMEVGFGPLTLSTQPIIGNDGPMWIGWGGDATPCIWRNTHDFPVFGIPPGSISIHPGNGTQPEVARWTSPLGASTTVHVVGAFLPGDGAYLPVTVRHNGNPVWDGNDSGAFDLQLVVAPGDTIDFAVYGGYLFGNTGLQATISSASCVGDLDSDSTVGPADLAMLLGAWGSIGGSADLDANGSVDAADLAVLLGAWGACR